MTTSRRLAAVQAAHDRWVQTEIAEDYGVAGDFAAVAELVAAGLAYDVARRRARLPRSHQPGGS